MGEAEEGPYHREEKEREGRWLSGNSRSEERSSEAANSSRSDGSESEDGVGECFLGPLHMVGIGMNKVGWGIGEC